jgi:hypothetical protein
MYIPGWLVFVVLALLFALILHLLNRKWALENEINSAKRRMQEFIDEPREPINDGMPKKWN